MVLSEGLICAYWFDGKGNARHLSREEIEQLPAKEEKGFLWLNLAQDSLDTKEWAKLESGLDPLVFEAMTDKEGRPRVTEYEKGTLVSLRGVNLNPGAEPEDMISLRIWVEAKRIVTLRSQRLFALDDFRARIGSGNAPRNRAEFVAWLARFLFKRMEPVVEEYEDALDVLEANLLKDPHDQQRAELVQLRIHATEVRRFISLDREVMALLLGSEGRWLLKSARQMLRENLDLVTRYVEELDLIRERAAILQEEVRNTLSERVNKNLYRLSIISAIFLPLTFLTGLLGINVEGIPHAKNPYAFYEFCASLAVVMVAQLILFRRLRWI